MWSFGCSTSKKDYGDSRICSFDAKGADDGQFFQASMDRGFQASAAASMYHAHFRMMREQRVIQEAVECGDRFVIRLAVQIQRCGGM